MTTLAPDARVLLALAIGVALPWASARADEGIATDRPDFTETAAPVERGMVQVEAGATRSRHGQSLGELLARIGVARRVELRLGFNSYVWPRGVPGGESGFEDLSVGMKVGVRDAGPVGSGLPA